jgi:cell division protein FtsI/penicillin-binding protein 2
MLRRRAVSILLGALAEIKAKASTRLDPFLDPSQGAALLLDIRKRRVIAINSIIVAARTLAPPGSTLKPFVLSALLRHGKLRPDTSFPCPGRLSTANRRFDCTHPRLLTPMRADTALAYSCNCFVAHAAEQFEPDELSRELEGLGLTSGTGLVGGGEVSGRLEPATTPDAIRMQSLGEAGILTTPLELALAYRQLAVRSNAPEMQPTLAGLEGAVEFGTARQAGIAGTKVAGKTGSTRSAVGDSIAWFAGFLPSRAPETVVVVMLSGHSGGSDAAPVASQILEAYRAGHV